MRTKRGFTLVEMLTVIVIIAILAAITMKLMVLVSHKTGRAQATEDIERIKHALVEYQAVYGIFPPASGMEWQSENVSYKPVGPPKDGLKLKEGLAAYLFNDSQCARWSPYLEGMNVTDLAGHRDDILGYGQGTWSNNLCTIKDPWGEDYVYATSDPYVAFKLYSMGPDRTANTADDVGIKWNE